MTEAYLDPSRFRALIPLNTAANQNPSGPRIEIVYSHLAQDAEAYQQFARDAVQQSAAELLKVAKHSRKLLEHDHGHRYQDLCLLYGAGEGIFVEPHKVLSNWQLFFPDLWQQQFTATPTDYMAQVLQRRQSHEFVWTHRDTQLNQKAEGLVLRIILRLVLVSHQQIAAICHPIPEAER